MVKKVNILIVEDNPDHVFLLTQMLMKIPSDSILYFEYNIKDADCLASASVYYEAIDTHSPSHVCLRGYMTDNNLIYVKETTP